MFLKSKELRREGEGEYDNGNQLYLHYKNDSSTLSFSKYLNKLIKHSAK